MKIKNPSPYSVMVNAFIRDGKLFHTGESMMLACLVHTTGKGRGTEDERVVREIMDDGNL